MNNSVDNSIDYVAKAFLDSQDNWECFKSPDFRQKITKIGTILADCLKSGGKILIAGNGGSHCSALHFAEELTGRFRKDRRPLAAIALGEATHASCVSNDYGERLVFDRQVRAFGKSGDVLLLLSTSGQSPNLKQTLASAQEQDMQTVALLGKGGGALLNMVRDGLVFPGKTSDRIQELQMFTLHLLVELIERDLFPELYE